MNRKQLCALIALSLGAAATAQAQDYDDRWYVNPYAGAYFNDEDRLSDDGTLLLGLGIGKYINPNAAIDVFVDRTQRGANEEGRILLGTDDSMDSTMYGVAIRWFFGDSNWRPFIMGGAGLINHRNGVEDGWDPGFQLGLGIQNSLTDRVSFRGEVAYRYDTDGDSIPDSDNYSDWMINLGVVIALGGASEEVVEERVEERVETPQTSCADLDDDKDQEVVLGHAAYHHDGQQYYVTGVGPGYPSIANLDLDPEPEVLITNFNGLSLLNQDRKSVV